jgi:hypothetical protein
MSRGPLAIEQVLERIEAGEHASGGQSEQDGDESDRGQRLGGI